jgi:hypothetical protein
MVDRNIHVFCLPSVESESPSYVAGTWFGADPTRAITRSSCGSVAEMPREYPKRRDQNSLRLLLAYRTSAPTLPHRPLAHAPLQADDVPDARAGAAGDTNRHHVRFAIALRTPPRSLQQAAHSQKLTLRLVMCWDISERIRSDATGDPQRERGCQPA